MISPDNFSSNHLERKEGRTETEKLAYGQSSTEEKWASIQQTGDLVVEDENPLNDAKVHMELRPGPSRISGQQLEGCCVSPWQASYTNSGP